MKLIKEPMDPGPAAWNCLLPKRTPAAPLSDKKNVDILIIGAGFAGISAARRLKQLDPSLSVAIVEARDIAEGPAGRNSGFMIDLPHNLASKDYAGDHARDQLQTVMNRKAISFAASAADDYEMADEAFEQSGKVNAAATSKGDHHNKDYANHLASLNEAYELLDARQMHALSGSKYYTSGLYTPGTAMLQPALYVRQFTDGLRKQGVEIFENAPVVNLARVGANWVASTPNGQIGAQKVILATNGHVESFGYFKRRLMHVYLYASMTRALRSDEIKKLGGETNWGFTPSDPMGTTVRKVSGASGTRILIRNSISWAPNRQTNPLKAEQYRAKHDQCLKARFPQLAGVSMEYRWGGLLCLSRNAVPAFGFQDENLIAACCQNGLGTAIGTLSGMAAAEKAYGIESNVTQFFDDQPAPLKLPPEPFSSLGANAVFKWGLLKAGREL